MIKLENTEIYGWEAAVRGMRNPKNSWDKSDSGWNTNRDPGLVVDSDFEGYCELVIGPKDQKLMMSLAKGGPVHAKYRRMIAVYVDITAPLYWWKEFDTYKVGTVANSCSTMHKIHAKEFTKEDFSTDFLFNNVNGLDNYAWLERTIGMLEANRKEFLALEGDEAYAAWHAMISMLPSCYNQKRTVMLNYEVLHNIYHSRRNHKLTEWHELCQWIEELPMSEIITLEEGE